MKLQIMSDLHLEMHADGGAELIRELDPTGVDVLVLAGDFTTARVLREPREAVQSAGAKNIATSSTSRETTSTTNRHQVRSRATC